jgi:hypothetical protein
MNFELVDSVAIDPLSPARAARDLEQRLAAGARLRPAGTARHRPRSLFAGGYVPKARLCLFDTTFYLTGVRQNTDIRFFVAYVVRDRDGRPGRSIYPRIFYKDVSLVWRSASHFVRTREENWIGKGAARTVIRDGEEFVESCEETTDLPLEIQSALESQIRRGRRIPHDDRAVGLVLRRAPADRVAPYSDFLRERERAAADPRNLPNRGRRIARFTRRGDPASLRFVRGYEPDFRDGIVEVERSSSRLYGGRLERYRIASTNRRVQFLFFAGPRQVWIGSCQATTTELSSYGVRTVDALVDDDLLLPGYEYHFMDDSTDPPELYSQIPAGYAGQVSEVDDSRVDTSRWLDRMPVVREFRRKVLARR